MGPLYSTDAITVSPRQSNRLLYRFLKKPEHLVDALERGGFIPRYSKEPLSELGIKELEDCYIAMTCFCDVVESNLLLHADLYGHYGISFDKKWGVANSLQMIVYVTPNSPLSQSLSGSFQTIGTKALAGGEADFLLSDAIARLLVYMKPAYRRFDEVVKEPRWMTDDCEWRYVLQDDFGSAKVVMKDLSENDEALLNDYLTKDGRNLLAFHYGEVESLCVTNSLERFDLENAIDRSKKLPSKMKKHYKSLIRIIEGGGSDGCAI